jgi:hypothetical protein
MLPGLQLGRDGWDHGTRCKYVRVSSVAPSMALRVPVIPPIPALDNWLVATEEAKHVAAMLLGAPW